LVSLQKAKRDEENMSQSKLSKFAATALFNLGFRAFFLGAGLYSVFGMFLWWLQFSGIVSINLTSAWHAHEMLFGYTFAVIAGFLLTSVRNWTGIDTATGAGLLILFSLWLLARLFNILGVYTIAAVCDLTFMLLFCWSVVVPIVKKKQWRQFAIMAAIIILIGANGFYYAGQLEVSEYGVYLGNYLGFYFVVGLVLVMTGRVVPFFVEQASQENVRRVSRSWLEGSILVSYVLWVGSNFFASETIELGIHASAAYLLAGLLFVLNSMRLKSWYTRVIWSKPLLWSLFVAYGFITFGFLLYALLYFSWYSFFIPLHAVAVGGIGLLTLSMMVRVSLGHSGRNIHEPSGFVVAAFYVLILASLVRVLLPWLDPQHKVWWVQTSQILWMITFAVFCILFAPILSQPRADGRPG
jgi:uncharacterized protein involved in response to NO